MARIYGMTAIDEAERTGRLVMIAFGRNASGVLVGYETPAVAARVQFAKLAKRRTYLNIPLNQRDQIVFLDVVNH
jgi:hypothetical protein